MKDFDSYWKIGAVLVAAKEQLENQSVLVLDELFDRARDIYNKGHEYDIKDWKSIWSDKKEEPIKAAKVRGSVEEKLVSEDPTKKICPSCNETVPKGWAKHTYTKDSSRCGHKFK